MNDSLGIHEAIALVTAIVCVTVILLYCIHRQYKDTENERAHETLDRQQAFAHKRLKEERRIAEAKANELCEDTELLDFLEEVFIGVIPKQVNDAYDQPGWTVESRAIPIGHDEDYQAPTLRETIRKLRRSASPGGE